MGRKGNADCTIEGCPNKELARGWCIKHYSRWRTHGDPEAQVRVRHASWKGQTCAVVGCDKPVHAKGFCPTHLNRVRLYGQPDGSFTTHKKCVLCGEPAVSGDRSSDHCREHYVEHVLQLIAGGKLQGCVTPAGYVVHQIFKTRYSEHRVVMEHMLGRPLYPEENVHHRNGRRNDNRPENLELWVKPQAAGQRAEDLVAWVIEHYPNQVRQALAEQEPHAPPP